MKNLLLTYFRPTLRISRKPTFDLLLSDFDFSAVLGPLEGNQPHNVCDRKFRRFAIAIFVALS